MKTYAYSHSLRTGSFHSKASKAATKAYSACSGGEYIQENLLDKDEIAFAIIETQILSDIENKATTPEKTNPETCAGGPGVARSERSKILFATLFSLMMIQTMFLNVENILPTWIPDHFESLSAIHISFILRYLRHISFLLALSRCLLSYFLPLLASLLTRWEGKT